MDPFELIFFLIVLALLALGFVLPIVALVLAITTRRRLNQEIARLRSFIPPDVAKQISPAGPATTATARAIQQLDVRINQIEATLWSMRQAPPQPAVPAEQPEPH